jgi:hypothetical protein
MANEGIKAKIESVLRAHPSQNMGMGQIMHLGDINKTMAADVASALNKLMAKGQVKAVRGPSPSPSGPRFVRLYMWVVKAPPRPPRVESVSSVPRRVFNF